jgi:hypothetical protein
VTSWSFIGVAPTCLGTSKFGGQHTTRGIAPLESSGQGPHEDRAVLDHET